MMTDYQPYMSEMCKTNLELAKARDEGTTGKDTKAFWYILGYHNGQDSIAGKIAGLKVYVVLYSKSKMDGVLDSSVHGCYESEEQAKRVCGEENQNNEEYHYYWLDYVIQPDTDVPSKEETKK